MRPLRAAFLVLALMACVGCDQATKAIARAELHLAPPVILANGIVRLQYVENHGGFLSLGANLPAFARFALFRVGMPLAVVACLVFVATRRHLGRAQLLGLALLLGGGAANVIDRLANDGAVVDFMSVGVGSLRSGIFNLADLAIIAGALLLAVVAQRPSNARV